MGEREVIRSPVENHPVNAPVAFVQGSEVRSLEQGVKRVEDSVADLRRILTVTRIRADPIRAMADARESLSQLSFGPSQPLSLRFSDPVTRLQSSLTRASEITDPSQAAEALIRISNSIDRLGRVIDLSRPLYLVGVPSGIEQSRIFGSINDVIFDSDSRRAHCAIDLLELYSQTPDAFLSSAQGNSFGRTLFSRFTERANHAHNGLSYSAEQMDADASLIQSLQTFCARFRMPWLDTSLSQLALIRAAVEQNSTLSREQMLQLKQTIDGSMSALSEERASGRISVSQSDVSALISQNGGRSPEQIRSQQIEQATALVHNAVSPPEGTSEWFGQKALEANAIGNNFSFQLALTTGLLLKDIESLSPNARSGILSDSVRQNLIAYLRDPTTTQLPSNLASTLDVSQVRARVELLRRQYSSLLNTPLVASALREIGTRLSGDSINTTSARKLTTMVSVYLELLQRNGSSQWLGRAEMEGALNAELRHVDSYDLFTRAFSRYQLSQNAQDLRRSLQWGRGLAAQFAIVNRNLTEFDRLLLESANDPTKLAAANQMLSMLVRYVDSVQRLGTRPNGTQTYQTLDRRFDGSGMETAMAAVASGRASRSTQEVFDQSFSQNYRNTLDFEASNLERLGASLRLDVNSSQVVANALTTIRARIASGDVSGAGRLIALVAEYFGSPQAATAGSPAHSLGWRYRSLRNSPQLRASFLASINSEIAVSGSGVSAFTNSMARMSRVGSISSNFAQFSSLYEHDSHVTALRRYEQQHSTEFSRPTLDELFERVRQTATSSSGDTHAYISAVRTLNTKLDLVAHQYDRDTMLTQINNLQGMMVEFVHSLIPRGNDSYNRSVEQAYQTALDGDIRPLLELANSQLCISREMAQRLLGIDTNRADLAGSVERYGVAFQAPAESVHLSAQVLQIQRQNALNYVGLLSEFDHTRRLVYAERTPTFIEGSRPMVVQQATELLQAYQGPLAQMQHDISPGLTDQIRVLEERRAGLANSLLRFSGGTPISPELARAYDTFVSDATNLRRRIEQYRYVVSQQNVTTQYINSVRTLGFEGAIDTTPELVRNCERDLRESAAILGELARTITAGGSGYETRATDLYHQAMTARMTAIEQYSVAIQTVQGTNLTQQQTRVEEYRLVDQGPVYLNPSETNLPSLQFVQYRDQHDLVFRSFFSPNVRPQAVSDAQTGTSLIEEFIFGVPLNHQSALGLSRTFSDPSFVSGVRAAESRTILGPNNPSPIADAFASGDFVQVQRTLLSNAFDHPLIAATIRDQFRNSLANSEFAVQAGLFSAGIAASLVNPWLGASIMLPPSIDRVVQEYNASPIHSISFAAWANLGIMTAAFLTGGLAQSFSSEAEELFARSVASGSNSDILAANRLLARASLFEGVNTAIGTGLTGQALYQSQLAAAQGDSRGVLLSGLSAVVPLAIGFGAGLYSDIRAGQAEARYQAIRTAIEDEQFIQSLTQMRQAQPGLGYTVSTTGSTGFAGGIPIRVGSEVPQMIDVSALGANDNSVAPVVPIRRGRPSTEPNTQEIPVQMASGDGLTPGPRLVSIEGGRNGDQFSASTGGTGPTQQVPAPQPGQVQTSAPATGVVRATTRAVWNLVASRFRSTVTGAPVSEQFAIFAQEQLETLLQSAASGDHNSVQLVGEMLVSLHAESQNTSGNIVPNCRSLMRRLLASEPVRTNLQALNDRNINLAIDSIVHGMRAEAIRRSPSLRGNDAQLNRRVSALLDEYSFSRSNAGRRATGETLPQSNIEDMIALVTVLERGTTSAPLEATSRRLGITEIPPAQKALIILDLLSRGVQTDQLALFELASQASTEGSVQIQSAIATAQGVANTSAPQQQLLATIGDNLAALLSSTGNTRALDASVIAVLRNPEVLTQIRAQYGSRAADTISSSHTISEIIGTLEQPQTSTTGTTNPPVDSLINLLRSLQTSPVATAFEATSRMATRQAELTRQVEQASDVRAREDAPILRPFFTQWPRVRRASNAALDWITMTAYRSEIAPAQTWEGVARATVRLRGITSFLNSPAGVAFLAAVGIPTTLYVRGRRNEEALRTRTNLLVERVLAPLRTISDSDLQWLERNSSYFVAIGTRGTVADSVNISEMTEGIRWSALFENQGATVLNPNKLHEFILVGRYLDARSHGLPTTFIESELARANIHITQFVLPQNTSPTFYDLVTSNLELFRQNHLIITTAEAMMINFCRDYNIPDSAQGVPGRALTLNGSRVAFNRDNVTAFLSTHRGTFHYLVCAMRDGRLPITYLADAITHLSENESEAHTLDLQMQETNSATRSLNLQALYSTPTPSIHDQIFPAAIGSGSFLAIIDYQGLRGGYSLQVARDCLDFVRTQTTGNPPHFDPTLLTALNAFVDRANPYSPASNPTLSHGMDIYGDPNVIFQAVRQRLREADVTAALQDPTLEAGLLAATSAGAEVLATMRQRGRVGPAILESLEPRLIYASQQINDPSTGQRISVDSGAIAEFVRSKSLVTGDGIPSVDSAGILHWLQQNRSQLVDSNGHSTVLQILYIASQDENIRSSPVSGATRTQGVEERMDRMVDQLHEWGLWHGRTLNERDIAGREAVRRQRGTVGISPTEAAALDVRAANQPHPLPIGAQIIALTREDLERARLEREVTQARDQLHREQLGLETVSQRLRTEGGVLHILAPLSETPDSPNLVLHAVQVIAGWDGTDHVPNAPARSRTTSSRRGSPSIRVGVRSQDLHETPAQAGTVRPYFNSFRLPLNRQGSSMPNNNLIQGLQKLGVQVDFDSRAQNADHTLTGPSIDQSLADFVCREIVAMATFVAYVKNIPDTDPRRTRELTEAFNYYSTGLASIGIANPTLNPSGVLDLGPLTPPRLVGRTVRPGLSLIEILQSNMNDFVANYALPNVSRVPQSSISDTTYANPLGSHDLDYLFFWWRHTRSTASQASGGTR